MYKFFFCLQGFSPSGATKLPGYPSGDRCKAMETVSTSTKYKSEILKPKVSKRTIKSYLNQVKSSMAKKQFDSVPGSRRPAGFCPNVFRTEYCSVPRFIYAFPRLCRGVREYHDLRICVQCLLVSSSASYLPPRAPNWCRSTIQSSVLVPTSKAKCKNLGDLKCRF